MNLIAIYWKNRDTNYILPAVAVEEIFSIKHTATDFTDWRKTQLPVISLNNSQACTVVYVIKTIGNHKTEIPYLGILNENKPKVLTIKSQEMTFLEDNINSEYIKAGFQLQEEKVYLPDIEKIAQAIHTRQSKITK